MVFAETIAPEWSVGMFGAVPCAVPVYTHKGDGPLPCRLLTFKVNRPVLRYVWSEVVVLPTVVQYNPAYPISRRAPPVAHVSDRDRILKVIGERSDHRSRVFGTVMRKYETGAS